MRLAVIDTDSGELLTGPDADIVPDDTGQLLRLHQALGGLIGEVMEARTTLATAAGERAGKLGRKVAADGLVGKLNSPEERQVDHAALRVGLLAAGLKPEDVERVVYQEPQPPKWKVSLADLNKLARIDDDGVRAALGAIKYVPVKRTLSVTKADTPKKGGA